MTDAERIATLERQVADLQQAVIALAMADYKALLTVAASSRQDRQEMRRRVDEMYKLHDQVSQLVRGQPFERT